MNRIVIIHFNLSLLSLTFASKRSVPCQEVKTRRLGDFGENVFLEFHRRRNITEDGDNYQKDYKNNNLSSNELRSFTERKVDAVFLAFGQAFDVGADAGKQ